MDLKSIQSLFSERDITKIKVGDFDIDGVLRGKHITRERVRVRSVREGRTLPWQ